MTNKNEVVAKPAGLAATMASKFQMEPQKFMQTIKSTVMPSSATAEEVSAFLMVAQEYGLNPLLREIHAFPKKGGGIQTVVGVDGWANLISGNKNFDGCEFEYENAPDGTPVATTCTLYRKDCTRPTKVTEYYDECKRGTEPWKQMPRRMLRHKALMQCGRIAFGLSGIVDEDEAQDIIKNVEAVDVPDPLAPGRHEAKPEAKKEEPKTIDAEAEVKAPESEVMATDKQIEVITTKLREHKVKKSQAVALMEAFGSTEEQGFEGLTEALAAELILSLKENGWLENFLKDI